MRTILLSLALPALLASLPAAQEGSVAERFQWADVDGDGQVDALLLAPGGGAQLLLTTPEGEFVDRTLELGLSELGPVSAARWGDVEGDGIPELLVLDPGGRVRLYAQGAAGAFSERTEALGLPERARVAEAEWIDFDQDGCGDLVLQGAEGQLRLLHGTKAGELEPMRLGAEVRRPEALDAVREGPAAAGSAVPSSSPAPDSPGKNPDKAGTRTPRAGSASRSSSTSGRKPASPGGSVIGSSLGLSLPAAPAIRDQATGGTLKASSSPTLGMLFPLSPQFYLDALTGFVGLGTTSPVAGLQLQVGGETQGAGGDFLRVGGASGASVGLDPDEIQARFNGVPLLLRLNEDGGPVTLGGAPFAVFGSSKIGIGTLTPDASLDVSRGLPSSASGGGYVVIGNRLGKNIGIDSHGIIARNNGSPSPLFLNRFGGRVVVGEGTQGSRLGIGTSAPQETFHVRGSGATGTVLVTPNVANSKSEVRLGARGVTPNGAILRYNGTTNNLELRTFDSTSESKVLFSVARDTDVAGFPTAGAKVGIGVGQALPAAFNLEVNGTAGKPGGGSWSVASDRRLKKNIQPLKDALARLMKLRGVTFEYRDPEAIHERPGEQIGMIAQEVSDVFPDWVENADDGYLRLSVHGFEALAVEALRELRKEKRAELEAIEAEGEAELAALRREHEERLDALGAAARKARVEQSQKLASLEAQLRSLARPTSH